MTARDIVFRHVATGPELTLVGSVMTARAGVIAPYEPIEKALALMEKRHVDLSPVAQGERLVGIVTAADLMAYPPAQFATSTPAEPDLEGMATELRTSQHPTGELVDQLTTAADSFLDQKSEQGDSRRPMRPLPRCA